ncbi:MAG: YcxB family protein [Pirellulaceae bacterium]
MAARCPCLSLLMQPNPYDPPQSDPALPPEPPVLAALVGPDGGMSIEFEFQREDLVGFALYHHKHSSATRTQQLRKLIVFGVAVVTLLAFLVQRGIRSLDDWLLVGGAALLVVGLFVSLPRIREWRLRKSIDKMYGEGRNPLLNGPRRIILTPLSLINSSPNSQLETRWSVIEKIVVTEQALYIYISSVSSVVVPRRAFTSDDHFQTFVHTAQEFHAGALAAENPLRTSP